MNLFAEMDKNDTNRDELILQQQRDIEREVLYNNLFPKFSGVLFFFLTMEPLFQVSSFMLFRPHAKFPAVIIFFINSYYSEIMRPLFEYNSVGGLYRTPFT